MTSAEAYRERVNQAVAYIRSKIDEPVHCIVSLGTGQNFLPKDFIVKKSFSYVQIPHFCRPTVDSHSGQLIVGSFHGDNIALLHGRYHYYEGFDLKEVTFPIRVLSQMGSRMLIAVNAAGGLNNAFSPASLMLLSDHINFIGANPLRGENNDDWGTRFPDMSAVYSRRLNRLALQSAKELGLTLHQGVYVALSGPSLETPAETRFLKLCGADAVGMSTVPETIVAKHAGMEVCGLSVIANVNDPDNFQPILFEEVVEQVTKAQENCTRLLAHLLQKIAAANKERNPS